MGTAFRLPGGTGNPPGWIRQALISWFDEPNPTALAIADMLLVIARYGDQGIVVQAGLHLMIEGGINGRIFYNDGTDIWVTQRGVVYRRLLKELIGSSSLTQSKDAAE